MKGYRHDDPVTAAALPYKQRDAEKKIATKQKRIETKLESELEGFFKPDTIFDAEAREAASSPSEDYLTVLAGQRQWIATTNFAGCAGRPPDSFANSVVLATSAKDPDALG